MKLPRFVDLFLEGMIWLCEYGFHRSSYEEIKASRNYLQVCYERLVSSPLEECSQVLNFIGIDLIESDLIKVIEHTRFDNMSRIHDPATALQGNVNPRKEYVLRKGTPASYRNVLKKETLERVESAYAKYLSA